MLTFCEVFGLFYMTRDPELSYTSAQLAVASFSVATNFVWKDDDGNQHEESMFIDCQAWSRCAEFVAKNVSKGDPVFIEGYLKQEKWTSKEGGKRSKHLVNVKRLFQLRDRPVQEET